MRVCATREREEKRERERLVTEEYRGSKSANPKSANLRVPTLVVLTPCHDVVHVERARVPRDGLHPRAALAVLRRQRDGVRRLPRAVASAPASYKQLASEHNTHKLHLNFAAKV
jgi:hypothetical protein